MVTSVQKRDLMHIVTCPTKAKNLQDLLTRVEQWESDLKRFLEVSNNPNAISEEMQVQALLYLCPDDVNRNIRNASQDLDSLEDTRLYLQRLLSNHASMTSRFDGHKTAPMDCTTMTDAGTAAHPEQEQHYDDYDVNHDYLNSPHLA